MSMHIPSQTPDSSEPPSPLPMNAAPGTLAPAPHKGLSKPWLALLVVAALLTLAIPGFFVLNGHGANPFVDRHGLPSNVPVPSGAPFKLMTDVSGTKEWYWTVESPNTPTVLRDFYQRNLSSNGWTTIQVVGDQDDYDVSGCQGNQLVFVSMATFA